MNPLFKTTRKTADFVSSHAKGVSDMITLNNLTEQSLLENLHMRFSEEIIYVCTALVHFMERIANNCWVFFFFKTYTGAILVAGTHHLCIISYYFSESLQRN
jgi:hypothetical protein